MAKQKAMGASFDNEFEEEFEHGFDLEETSAELSEEQTGEEVVEESLVASPGCSSEALHREPLFGRGVCL